MTLRRSVFFLLAIAALLAASGCTWFRRELPRPGRTVLDSDVVEIPARRLGNFLIVEGKWDKRGPYRFLIDTGASVTLVTPELASRYPSQHLIPPATPLVRVKSAEGETALLTATTLRRLQIGGARFDDVQALIYDCASLSAHLGVKIDGILGFPLFRETILTLDYPNSRVVIQPRRAEPLLPGTTIAFNNDRRTPIIPLRLGNESFIALLDSGSDASLSLNPIGMDPAYATPPRAGATIATINGDRAQQIGRLDGALEIGGFRVEKPVVDLTEDLSSLGGGILQHFAVSFDQENGTVTFHRESTDPIPPEPRRSSGLSFTKTPAYWRVAAVVPGSPADAAGVQAGDLVTRIDGELVSAWDLQRYEELVGTADSIQFTFLNGTREEARSIEVFDLVP
mgnify:CR=1 FL=1